MKLLGWMLLIVLTVSVSQAQVDPFKKADSVAHLYPGHSLSDLGMLSYQLTSTLHTDKDKFRAIYKWVCTNIEGDYDLMMMRKRGDAFNFIIETLLTNHKTLCTGYAWLVRELSLRAGIECEIVNGYGRSPKSNVEYPVVNHSWNVVKLDDRWYLCDPTWSSGLVSVYNIFTFSFNESYFLADPELFILNHYPEDVKWSLMEKTPTLESFLNAPLIYASAYKYKVKPLGSLHVQISKNQPVLFNYLEDGMLSTQTETFKKRGTYPYHIKINNEYVISYKVTVR